MLAAKYCSMLFSSTCNKLFILANFWLCRTRTFSHSNYIDIVYTGETISFVTSYLPLLILNHCNRPIFRLIFYLHVEDCRQAEESSFLIPAEDVYKLVIEIAHANANCYETYESCLSHGVAPSPMSNTLSYTLTSSTFSESCLNASASRATQASRKP